MLSNGSLALLVAALINALLPGPCALLIVGRTLRAGLAGGATVAAGAFLADVILILGALGLVAGAIALSPVLLAVMKWVGVAVLVAMAIRALPRRGPAREAARARAGDVLAGFAVGLASPYNLIFYLALVPHAFAAGPNTTAGVMVAALAVLVGVALGQGALVLGARLCGGGRRVGWRGVDYASSLALLGFAALAAIGTVAPPGPEVGPGRAPAPVVEVSAR